VRLSEIPDMETATLAASLLLAEKLWAWKTQSVPLDTIFGFYLYDGEDIEVTGVYKDCIDHALKFLEGWALPSDLRLIGITDDAVASLRKVLNIEGGSSNESDRNSQESR